MVQADSVWGRLNSGYFLWRRKFSITPIQYLSFDARKPSREGNSKYFIWDFDYSN